MREHSQRCCDVRRQLAEAFAVAARHYSDSAVILATLGISEMDYARVSKLTLEAQSRSEAAFALYEEHVDLHRCFNGAPRSTRNATVGI